MRKTVPEVTLTRYAALMFLLIAAGCRSDAEQSYNRDFVYSPMIIIHFRETEISSSLPWDISSDRSDVSASMILSGNVEIITENNRLIREALENNMLLAIVSDSCITHPITNRDHIQIWTDSTGSVKALPEEILDEIPNSEWLSNSRRHYILLQLFDNYKPDLILMDFRIPDASAALRTAQYWTTADILSLYTVVLFRLSDRPDERGWCAFAGKRINGSTPRGLTEEGLFSTIRLLAGIRWEDDLPDFIPAISILKDTENIWNHGNSRP